MPAVFWSTMARKRVSLSAMAASARWRSREARLNASPRSFTSRRLVATGKANSPLPIVRAAAVSCAIERAIHSPPAAAPTMASVGKKTRFKRTCRSQARKRRQSHRSFARRRDMLAQLRACELADIGLRRLAARDGGAFAVEQGGDAVGRDRRAQDLAEMIDRQGAAQHQVAIS